MTVSWSTFRRELKRRRENAGLTQRELAERLGVAPNTAARWEQRNAGNRLPSLRLLSRLADVLGCSVGDLLAEKRRKGR